MLDSAASERYTQLADSPLPAHSPFVVGIVRHQDLEPSRIESLVDAASSILTELKQHLPGTELRLMLDGGGNADPAIARAASALGLFVEPSGSTDTLIRRSSLLLALWDGLPATPTDVTAHTVVRFLGCGAEKRDAAKAFEMATALDDADATAQLVYWLPAARAGARSIAGSGEPCFLLSVNDGVFDAQASMPASLRRRLADLDDYNREFERCIASGRLVCSRSLLDRSAEPAATDATILEHIDRQYVKADSMATHMQWRSDRLFNLFSIMTFTMGIAYLIYDQIFESRVLLIIYMLILFSSFLAYYLFQQKRWFGKHLSYRALAETLRVRFYLSLAGIDQRMHTGDLIALTGIHRFRGFSWIGFVLDTIESPALAARQTEEVYTARGRLVEGAWVEGQYQYFVRKVAHMQKLGRRVARLKGTVFVVALGVISAMFIFGEQLHHVDSYTGLPVKNVLEFCSGFLAVVLGVWELRQSKMAARELLWQYRNQLDQFSRARTQLRRSMTKASRDDLLAELGDNSLMETYLWAIHRYHREHAPPTIH
jgi:hypothetical protein